MLIEHFRLSIFICLIPCFRVMFYLSLSVNQSKLMTAIERTERASINKLPKRTSNKNQSHEYVISFCWLFQSFIERIWLLIRSVAYLGKPLVIVSTIRANHVKSGSVRSIVIIDLWMICRTHALTLALSLKLMSFGDPVILIPVQNC